MTLRKKAWSLALYWVAMILLLSAGGWMLFEKLGDAAISDCDEARHGINAYEMLQNGESIVSTYRGETDYWNLKPPLTYWCIMLGYRIFGYNALGMRAYSALSMLLLMAVTALWSLKRYGKVASLCTALFWLGLGAVYGPHFARFGDADAQVALLSACAMLCMLKSERDVRWLYAMAVFFGLAFLSKSWHAGLIPATCLIWLLVTGNAKRLKLRQWLLMVVFAVLPVFPWAVARYARDGFAFFKRMFTRDFFERSTQVIEGHEGDWLYYVRYLATSPAVAAAGATCLIALLARGRRKLTLNGERWGLLLWFAVPVILYSLCVSKLEWYVFACFAPLSILFGMACGGLARAGRGRVWRSIGLAAAVGVMAWLGSVNAIEVSQTVNTDTYQRLMASYFDRDLYAGARCYIEYEAENDYAQVDTGTWVQDEVLCAQLVGDLDCRDGGLDAYFNETSRAFLLIHKSSLGDWAIMDQAYMVAEEGQLMLLQNIF